MPAKKLQSRFKAKCINPPCPIPGRQINEGDWIWWEKDFGPFHVNCSPSGEIPQGSVSKTEWRKQHPIQAALEATRGNIPPRPTHYYKADTYPNPYPWTVCGLSLNDSAYAEEVQISDYIGAVTCHRCLEINRSPGPPLTTTERLRVMHCSNCGRFLRGPDDQDDEYPSRCIGCATLFRIRMRQNAERREQPPPATTTASPPPTTTPKPKALDSLEKRFSLIEID